MNRLSLAVAVAVALVVGDARPVRGAESEWVTRFIGTGHMARLAIAPDGTDRVAFVAADGVHVASDASGSWVDTRILAVDASGVQIDMAVDAEGHVHVAMALPTDEPARLSYATDRSGKWATRPITTEAGATDRVAIAVDPEGEVHLARSGAGQIDYWTNRSGLFRGVRLVESNGYDADLALDGDRRIHVVYERRTDEPGIHYVTNRGGWRFERLTIAGVVPDRSPTIAVERDGTSHIAYSRWDTDLRYLTNGSGRWAASRVSALHGANPNIVWTAGGPRIAFDASGVRVAVAAGGVWTTTRVSFDGHGPSLAIGPAGERRVVFVTSGSGSVFTTVQFGTSAASGWTAATITSSYLNGAPAVVVDVDGHVHMAWATEGAEPGIRYRTDASGSWVTKRITTSPDRAPSIAIDPAGKVHVAFERLAPDWTAAGVFVVTNASGAWVERRVRVGAGPLLSGETTDRCPTIAISGTGVIRVAMFDSYIVPGSIGRAYALFTDDGGGWTRKSISTRTALPLCLAMRLDAGGRAHVAWQDETYATNPGLLYAVEGDSGFAVTKIVSGEFGAPGLVVTPAGVATIIVGRANATQGFRLFTNAAGPWTRSEVRAPALGSGRPAVALVDGSLHVAYGSVGLIYGSDSGGSWVFHRPYSKPAGIGPFALATDEGGKVWIGLGSNSGSSLLMK